MVLTNVSIPSNKLSSILLAPSRNGFKLVMKSDRFAAIAGNEFVTPSPKPPIIDPMNNPIALPIAPRSSPPLSANSETPGILWIPPNIASTAVNSIATSPIAIIPFIAAAAIRLIPAATAMIPAIDRNPFSASDNIPGSACANASIIPENN